MEVLRVTPNLPNCAERARYNVGWLLFVAGALATFRLSHLVSKERGPLSVFERIRNALPRGRGLGPGMAQLHLLFFSDRERCRLRASLDRWVTSHAAGMDRSLARFQCSRADS